MARPKSAPRGANPHARSNIKGRIRVQKHQPTAEAAKAVADPPIRIWLDPNMPAIPLIEDLASLGLELATDKDGFWWLRRTDVLKATPYSRLAHFGAVAEALDVPLWVLMIPDMPPELLKSPHGLIGLVKTYCAASVERRATISAAADAVAESPASTAADSLTKGDQAAGKSLAERIHDQRGEIFGAMAIVAVTRDSINFEDDCDRHRALRDTYRWLDRIASDLCEIADDANGGVS